DGSRWTIYQSVDVNLVPKGGPDENPDCEDDPDAEGCKSGSGGSSSGSGDNDESNAMMYVAIAGGALLLLIVIIVTLILFRGRVESDAIDTGTFGGDDDEMDPFEAYVQKLFAQVYPEETARAYAQQYYAQAAQQQQ
ncbi:MAG: hypothetical protein VX473_05380, partial [Candidatus Thermoplasmatota archaeon]|nr:hypothetical protein [Candidatus Thermoplasmatota archaeon]